MNSLYQRAHFMLSAANLSQAPPDQGREVAFAGRSNAGKSSAINVICNQKGLARTSKTPGRTQLLNFFHLDDSRRLVDLPGYGYAKVAESKKRQWQASLADYLERRRSLRGLVLLMDIRHPLTDFDRQMLTWSREIDLPVHLLLTKADKLKRGAATQTLRQVEKTLAAAGLQPGLQLFSAHKRLGLEQARAALDCWFGISAADKKDPGV